ncbi:putative transcription factor bZIP family [Helianthus anomalus]
MEHGHNMSTVDNLQMIPFDDNDPEVIARRIKNRERQRRYRARKRQEADSKRASMINHQVDQTQVNNTPVNILTDVYSQQVEQTQVNETPANIVTPPVCEQVDQTQGSDTPVNIVTRVYSQRNWKKDARTAHLLKQQKLQQQSVASSTCATASTDLGLSGIQSNVIVDTREHSSTPSGRNWKAEARNKRY